MDMDVDYQKYLKYKTKYFNLKKLLQVGGDSHCERKQKEMFYDNKPSFGTILRNTHIYDDSKSMKIIGTAIQNTIIFVQKTEEKNGIKFHYCENCGDFINPQPGGWIDYNDISCK
jgi:hypothetical protein